MPKRMKHIGLFSTVCLTLLSLATPGLQVTASAEEPGLVGKRIIIDAGHGGPDGGARGANGENEKDITLAIALKFAELLRQNGAVAVVTRTEDRDFATDDDRSAGRRHLGDLKNRLIAAKKGHSDAFISIHCNAVPSTQWRGAQTIYMEDNEEGKRLATDIQEALREGVLPTNRAAHGMATLYLLKRMDAPSALVEVGFLSNPDEASHLVRSEYQKQIALALVVGLYRYFGTPPAGKGSH